MKVQGALEALTTGLDDLKAAIFDAETLKVRPQTLRNLVEMSVLRASSLVEIFFRDVFYLSMLNEGGQVGVSPVLNVADESEVDLIVFGFGSRREKFLDWIPFEYALDRAEALLRFGLPFTRIKYRPVERRALSELTTLRNAVAHPSDHAQRKFLTLAQQRNYPVSRPGEYLLSTRGGEWEVLLLLTRLEVTACGLAAGSDSEANGILEPEDVFGPQQTCPPGEYVCNGCGADRALTVEAKLGPCPSCSAITECPSCGRTRAASTGWTRTYS